MHLQDEFLIFRIDEDMDHVLQSTLGNSRFLLVVGHKEEYLERDPVIAAPAKVDVGIKLEGADRCRLFTSADGQQEQNKVEPRHHHLSHLCDRS